MRPNLDLVSKYFVWQLNLGLYQSVAFLCLLTRNVITKADFLLHVILGTLQEQ